MRITVLAVCPTLSLYDDRSKSQLEKRLVILHCDLRALDFLLTNKCM